MGSLQGLGSLEDLARSGGVYSGICCHHPQPSLGSPPPHGQPLWGRAPSLSEPHCPPGGVPETLGQQDAGGTVPHAGAWVQPPCAPVQASVGDQGGSGSPHCHHPRTVISAPSCASPRGQRAEGDWSSRWPRHRLPPAELDFWDCFDDRPSR